MKTNFNRNIVSHSQEQLNDVLKSNKNMTENSLRMRVMAYLAQNKANLLTETILEFNQDKKKVTVYANSLEEKNQLLEEQKLIIQKQNDKLEKQVELEKQLNQQKEELLIHKSKMATMGEMIENIIHQWRQPLSVISVSASGLKLEKEFDTLSDEFLLKTLDGISTATNHLSTTINDFRDYFKPDKRSLNFNINEIIEKAIFLLDAKFKYLNIEVINNSSVLTTFGLKNEFIQSFINILNNAEDALLESKNLKKLIFINTDVKNDKIEISIKDNAGGIPDDIIDKIFDSYFTTKEESEGTGIGLYMTKTMIENHMNGNIKVQNNDFEYENICYRGAEFIITLPFSE